LGCGYFEVWLSLLWLGRNNSHATNIAIATATTTVTDKGKGQVTQQKASGWRPFAFVQNAVWD
jgi:hypothetical protein